MLEFGWPNYLRATYRPSLSLSNARSSWSAFSQVRYDTLADKAWLKPHFIARPLSDPWPVQQQPVMAVSSSRLLVAAGSTIYSYVFCKSNGDDLSPSVQFEASFKLGWPPSVRREITALSFAPDGLDLAVYIGFDDGVLECASIPQNFIQGSKNVLLDRTVEGPPRWFDHREVIVSFSAGGSTLLCLSLSGKAGLINTLCTLPEQCTSTYLQGESVIELRTRSWSSYVSIHSSTPYAAFGTSSKTPLAIHSITNTELQSVPSAILHANMKQATENRSSAVYGICGIPPSGPWGGSDQILVSGWYDGVVRVHDLRSSSRITLDNANPHYPAPILPVLSLYDSFSFEPIYAVACGGGSTSHIGAGTARHSVVAFWDVRRPTQGWSVHAPGNDSSPVYSIHLESSRLFGTTQSRPFVYDFGPGVTNVTYPQISNRGGRGVNGLKSSRRGIGYYVTKYHHSHSNS